MTARPDSIFMPAWVYDVAQRRTIMAENITVGLDLAKNVFQRTLFIGLALEGGRRAYSER